MIVPQLKALYKEEGEQGRQKFNLYTRILTVPLGIVQSISMITLFRSQGLVTELSRLELVTAVAVITAGTVLLMWIGEFITNQNIGNGISLIIFAGIIAGFPAFLNQFLINFQRSEIPTYAIYLVITLLIIYAIIYVTEGQRNIPISYSKSARSVSMVRSHVDTYLPLKVNQAGVIPIIFAVSLMVFPQVLLQFLSQTSIEWIVPTATSLLSLWLNPTFYASAYFVLVFVFTYFYTSIIFEPQSIAENLQRQGGFITGVRPGQKTADYLSYVSNRIILFGALFLSSIAVLPFIMTGFTGDQTLAIGGTSLLIVVSVVLETMKQIDSQIITRDYDHL
jgi:preprotein translocase subunit SecY